MQHSQPGNSSSGQFAKKLTGKIMNLHIEANPNVYNMNAKAKHQLDVGSSDTIDNANTNARDEVDHQASDVMENVKTDARVNETIRLISSGLHSQIQKIKVGKTLSDPTYKGQCAKLEVFGQQR